ncbi:MAG: chromosomal replication initiator protein DnaA [Pseudomonadota bacterium]
MAESYWTYCFEGLRESMDEQEFDRLVRPLQVKRDGKQLEILAPNRYILDDIVGNHIGLLERLLERAARHIDGADAETAVRIEVGNLSAAERNEIPTGPNSPARANGSGTGAAARSTALQEGYTFESFVAGRSNELACAAAHQVSENTGATYNPLLIYGGVGLGKTHLMHAVGNTLLERNGSAKVLYVHSQRFVQDMVDALRNATMTEFTRFYKHPDVLLIDDVQFFENKIRSQDAFFNIFNSLLERGRQIILTCDRYPREIEGLEERLKSRFVWGLTVEVEQPELETRVAILRKKAAAEGIDLDTDVAFYIAERIRSNVRELEGALKRAIVNSRLTGAAISIEQVQTALRDLFAVQTRLITVDRIQKLVAEYYNIKVADLLSKRRNRAVVRPRQMAMTLAREYTQSSLPEIGYAFGGKDHTTVMHASRKIAELKDTDPDIMEDWRNLSRLLNS